MDLTIREAAQTIKKVVEFNGDLVFDTTKPDGVSRKLIDVSRLTNMGWRYSIDFEQGLQQTYAWYLNNLAK